MENTKRLLAIACLSLGLGVALAQESQPPQDPQEEPQEEALEEPQAEAPPPEPAPVPVPVTLGDFVMRVAAGLKLPSPETGFTPESAAWAMVHQGIRVRPELSSPLTEADAVAVLMGMGYRIRTATPSRVMTSDRVDLLLETFIPPDKS